jgi:hypothetical protein
MYVLAVEAVGHLIAMGLPDHMGACREQTINRRCGARSRRMRLEPQRGPFPEWVENILDGSWRGRRKTA